MYKKIPELQQLPYALYNATQVQAFDKCIIEEYNISGTTLMERAGAAAWNAAYQCWPAIKNVTVLCGTGNNGGDGYVVARLALDSGCVVQLLQLGNINHLTDTAKIMLQRYQAAGGTVKPFEDLPRKTDLIVDAMLGTGLTRDVTGIWANAITAINSQHAPILALDIPSGLNANTGHIMGCAVRAQLTVTFIALKQGLFTGYGLECCGKIEFNGLQAPAAIYSREILNARRIDWPQQASTLCPRPRNSHKGNFGHVLIIGGAAGMNGALRLAGAAAARCGAGIVTLAAAPGQGALLNLAIPELLCYEVANVQDLEPLLARATVIAIGPGLGKSNWAQQLLNRVLNAPQSLVVDADALNLLALSDTAIQRSDWVLTPHPKEAARLLKCSTAEIQEDRFLALQRLVTNYGGTLVLKGSGTLIGTDSHKNPAICSAGNPGMATAGMGDLLTGIIAGFIAQGWSPKDAAYLGVCLHAAAGDLAAYDGERGLLASDLLPYLRKLLNPRPERC